MGEAMSVDSSTAPDPNVTVTADVEGFTTAIGNANDAAKALAKPETDWKAEARKWEDRAKANKDAADKLAEIEAEKATDLERAVTAAREEGRTEVLSKANQRLINAEVRALAAQRGFRDPHDAIAQLRDNLGSVAVTDDGVDTEALGAALAELAERKPYLLASDDKQTGPRPDQGQGPRTNSPEALSDAEYERFYPSRPTR